MSRWGAVPSWMDSYFAAEKAESLLFVAVGVLAVVVSAALLLRRSVYRAAAIPLLAIAALQIGVGASVYLRTDEQVRELARQLDQEPAAFREQEGERMRAVNESFALYRRTEMALAFVGFLLAFLGRTKERKGMLAFGAALALQASIMLALDLAAEARAHEYAERVERVGSATPTAGVPFPRPGSAL